MQAKIYGHYLAEIMVDFAYFVAEAIRNNVRSIDGGTVLWRFIFVLQIFLSLSEFGTISTSWLMQYGRSYQLWQLTANQSFGMPLHMHDDALMFSS